jgi:hypothetical protein
MPCSSTRFRSTVRSDRAETQEMILSHPCITTDAPSNNVLHPAMLRYAVPTCCRCTAQVGTVVKHLAAWLMQALGWGMHLHGAQAVVVAADVAPHHGDGLRDGLQRRLVPPPHQRPHLPQGGQQAPGLVE